MKKTLIILIAVLLSGCEQDTLRLNNKILYDTKGNAYIISVCSVKTYYINKIDSADIK